MNKCNGLHFIDCITSGDDAPSVVNAIIEIPKGGRVKYEVDRRYGILKVDRVLPVDSTFPINYGLIPRTLGEDGDPLDILVLASAPIKPLSRVECRVIGVMLMVDQGDADHKILAVMDRDADYSSLKDIEDVPMTLKKEIKGFFENYKKAEKKYVFVETFRDKLFAYDIIEEAMARYKFKPTEAELIQQADNAVLKSRNFGHNF